VRLEPRLSRTAWRDLAWIASACIAAVVVGLVLPNLIVRLVIFLLVGVACAAVLLTFFTGGRPLLAKSG
jgi:hypothetical protein